MTLRDIAGLGFPALGARLLIDGDQTTVRGSHDGQVVVQRHTSIGAHPDGLKRRTGACRLQGFVSPQQLARAQVVGEHLTLGTTLKDSTVFDQRVAHQAILGGQIHRPDQPQLCDGLGVDLIQFRVVLNFG